jgi:hypothetical protein
MSGVKRASFVVRVVDDRRGQPSGVIERVATGAKEAFRGLEAIGPVIKGMLQDKRVTKRSRPPGSPMAPLPGECRDVNPR